MPTKEVQYINEKAPAPKPKRQKVNEKPVTKSRGKKSTARNDDEPTFIGTWVANTNWPELFRELSGLILLVFGLVVMFSLLSYDPNDRSVNTAVGAVRTNNWIGPVGANIATTLYGALGVLALVIPLLLLAVGWFLLRPRQLKMPVVKMFGWLMVIGAIFGLLALSDLEMRANGSFYLGGWIGHLVVKEGLVDRVNMVGTFILLLAMLIAGLVISTPFSMSWLPRFLDDILPGDQLGWWESVKRSFGGGGARDEEVSLNFSSRRPARTPVRQDLPGRKTLETAINGKVKLGTGALRKADAAAPPLEVLEEEAENIEIATEEPEEVVPEIVIPKRTAKAPEAEEPSALSKVKSWPVSLRGDQAKLPIHRKTQPEPQPVAPEEEDFDSFNDDLSDHFDDVAATTASALTTKPGVPRPPTPPPLGRTVDEMLASATVKRIASPEPPEVVKESKLQKLAKSAARMMAHYKLPESDILTEAPPRPEFSDDDLMERARLLAEKCKEFNVSGKVTRISPGPVVTTFEFKPDPGVKYSRITGLVDDLCLGLKAESVRIDRIPGKSTVGIEVPNTQRETIRLREVIEAKEFREARSRLTLALGKNIYGSHYVADLAKMPHLLIAGATGAGKSVALNSILISILYRNSPNDVKLILVDPKRLELGLYADIPHLLTPIVTDPKRASYSLRWAVSEMESRYKHLAAFGVRNIEQYNHEVLTNPSLKPLGDDSDDKPQPLPYIVVIIDELADLMMVSARDVEESITRLAQMARAVGIHLILATQRPSVDVITGLIKANFPSRIAFRVSSKVDSRTIIDSNGAESLLGQGDMLFLPPGTSRLVRVHGAYVDEKEVKRVCDFIRAQGQPAYDERVTMSEKEAEGGEGEDRPRDEKYYDAVKIVIEMGRASTSVLQRRLGIGYGRAASIIDMMEREGIVGPSEGASKPRQVLVKADFLERLEQIREDEY
jgi:S-DNA-T family DNA segregation ATPase FtsK/SpoIIIE